jgi:hypothetical protein
MVKIRKIKETVWVCIAVMLFLMPGCANSPFTKGGFLASKTSVQKSKKAPKLYGFDDVRIPSELKKNDRSSFVYKTPGFAGGVVSFAGRVEMDSLVTFFENNMSRDNWRLISSFKSPRTIMLFHKESKWCVISISEKEFSTYAEIWVAPTINEIEKKMDEGLLK